MSETTAALADAAETIEHASAEIERLQAELALVNARCDHLGMRLGEVIQDRDCEKRLRKASDDLATALQERLDAAVALERERWKAALKLQHEYFGGGCPDEVNGWDARDPQCPACRALLDLGA